MFQLLAWQFIKFDRKNYIITKPGNNNYLEIWATAITFFSVVST